MEAEVELGLGCVITVLPFGAPWTQTPTAAANCPWGEVRVWKALSQCLYPTFSSMWHRRYPSLCLSFPSGWGGGGRGARGPGLASVLGMSWVRVSRGSWFPVGTWMGSQALVGFLSFPGCWRMFSSTFPPLSMNFYLFLGIKGMLPFP